MATKTSEETQNVYAFQSLMISRFIKGRKKYKSKYLNRDNLSELQDELVDVANYAMMEWFRIEKLKKHKDAFAALKERMG